MTSSWSIGQQTPVHFPRFVGSAFVYWNSCTCSSICLQCRCQRCHPEAGIHANAIQPAQNHTPFSDHLNNRDIQEVTLDGKRLHIGTKTRCYYRKRGSQDLYLWHNKGLSVIHAVLWPTLLFIAGFVGLFFSCISLQKSTYLMKLNKRMPSNV